MLFRSPTVVSVLDYNGGPHRLIAVRFADVLVDPVTTGVGHRAKEENRAMVFYEEIVSVCQRSQLSGPVFLLVGRTVGLAMRTILRT